MTQPARTFCPWAKGVCLAWHRQQAPFAHGPKVLAVCAKQAPFAHGQKVLSWPGTASKHLLPVGKKSLPGLAQVASTFCPWAKGACCLCQGQQAPFAHGQMVLAGPRMVSAANGQKLRGTHMGAWSCVFRVFARHVQRFRLCFAISLGICSVYSSAQANADVGSRPGCSVRRCAEGEALQT